MAILKIFSVYDSKAAAYLPPFFLPRTEQAERAFQQCAGDKKHQFGSFPEDYTLYEIGTFDDENAILSQSPPVCLGTALKHRAIRSEQEKATEETEQ